MRPLPNKKIEKNRVRHPLFTKLDPTVLDGAYEFSRPGGIRLFVIATLDVVSPKEAWEHVSVVAHEQAASSRIPTWDEMCWVKRQFWQPDEVGFQIHPKESDYVNVHNHCLHIWRPVGVVMPEPPSGNLQAQTAHKDPTPNAILGHIAWAWRTGLLQVKPGPDGDNVKSLLESLGDCKPIENWPPKEE